MAALSTAGRKLISSSCWRSQSRRPHPQSPPCLGPGPSSETLFSGSPSPQRSKRPLSEVFHWWGSDGLCVSSTLRQSQAPGLIGFRALALMSCSGSRLVLTHAPAESFEALFSHYAQTIAVLASGFGREEPDNSMGIFIWGGSINTWP